MKKFFLVISYIFLFLSCQEIQADVVFIHTDILGSPVAFTSPNAVPIVPPTVIPTSPPIAVTSIDGSVRCTLICAFSIRWSHSKPETVTYYELYSSAVRTSSCPPKMICLDSKSLTQQRIIIEPTTEVKIYSGVNNTFTGYYDDATNDFKVRACNNKGCSAYITRTLSNEL
jgi:hypothetical protein